MNRIFVEKDNFISMALQLDSRYQQSLKPYVAKMYKMIHLYNVTQNEKILMSLLYLLMQCNSSIVNILIKNVNNHKLYIIKE